MKTLSEERDKIKKIVENFKKSEQNILENFLAYLEIKDERPETYLYQFGIPPDRIKELSKILSPKWEQIVREKAENYIKRAWEDNISHKECRDLLDKAIKMLQRLREDKGGLSAESLVILAKAYLRRSQIVRPKGLTTPVKKREAIEKGIKIADEAINQSTDAGIREEAFRIRGLLYVEMERILESDERRPEVFIKIKEALNEAIKNGCDKFQNLEDDKLEDNVKIAIVYSEICKELGEDIKSEILEQIANLKLNNIELEKVRAYRLLNNSDKLREEFLRLTNRLYNKNFYIPFSSPIWDDAVRFLLRLYKDADDLWKELSIALWEICKKIEENTPLTLHIRWYWSRMRDLYDLAFLAIDDKDISRRCRLRAEIADSLKSRPAIKWNVLEELKESDDVVKELYEAEAKAFRGGYIENFDKLKEEFKKEFTPTEILDLQKDVPKGWIVIHFYINHFEKRERQGKGGYALIYDKDSDIWLEKIFEVDKLFHAYMTWQADYNRNGINSASSLEKLCMTIGDAMPFLFELPAERSVLFIPHNFLHRLPLHGAIKSDNGKPKEIFLEKHTSCYLPTWRVLKKKDKGSVVSGKYILQDKNEFDNMGWDGNYHRFDDLPNNPEFLFISCHGKADHVNPFNTRLKINGDGKTYLDLRRSDKTFAGTHLILGACETDLVSPLSDIIDEHLSISTVFLDKNACEIIGTMWVVAKAIIEKLIKELIAKCCNVDLWMMKELQKWQKTLISNYFNGDIYDLNHAVVFRVIGFYI